MRESLVFNIQRYSLHDGGGIRTIIFFKGCPFRCPWCSNPESQSFEREILRKPTLCIQCQSDSCFTCKANPEDCPTNALEWVGKKMSIDEIVEAVQKDMIFYDSTKGGVTVSGGEPLAQGQFLVDLLKRLKQLGIHTAIETTGVSSWELLDEVSNYIDLFLFDLKIMDKQKSMEVVKADADIVKDNLRRLVAKGANIIPRIPLIPGYTMDLDNIKQITDIVLLLKLMEVHILPFHQFGSGKYTGLNRDYSLKDLQPPTDDEVKKIQSFMEDFGLTVYIGGR